MKRLLMIIHNFIIALGCARAAAELSRLGKHEQARRLINECEKHDV
jgi:hypothetical protein